MQPAWQSILFPGNIFLVACVHPSEQKTARWDGLVSLATEIVAGLKVRPARRCDELIAVEETARTGYEIDFAGRAARRT